MAITVPTARLLAPLGGCMRSIRSTPPSTPQTAQPAGSIHQRQGDQKRVQGREEGTWREATLRSPTTNRRPLLCGGGTALFLKLQDERYTSSDWQGEQFRGAWPQGKLLVGPP